MSRDLFGGAMRTALPDRFVDVSTFRQVPDNQEVFTDPSSEQSIIVEILEYVSAADMAEQQEETADDGGDGSAMDPPLYFFNDLAEANGLAPGSADLAVLSSKSVAPATGCPALPAANVELFKLVGTQRVPKFNAPASEASTVTIHLYNIRLKAIQTDIVISVNVPNGGGAGGGGGSAGDGVVGAAGAVGVAGAEEAKMDMDEAMSSEGAATGAGWDCDALAKSLEIIDWSLFG